jgi:hypothetical protein
VREYGQVQCSFWTDPDLQSLSGDHRLLALYLLTGPHSNGLGCYRCPDGYVTADLGWSSERVSKGFTELSRIGFTERCETTFFVLIPKYLRWNPIANVNVAKARMAEFEAVSKKANVFSRLCDSMMRFGNHWPNGFETVLKGYAERYGKQDPTLPDPTRTEPTPLAPSPSGLDAAASPPNGKKLNGHTHAAADSPVAITIPLVGTGEYRVTEAQVKAWDELFPAVDVPQTLREIKAWNLSHPQRRKTERGVQAHITGWLAKEQNKG